MGAQDIANAYQLKLGRAPDARELESEIENDAKYGHAQLLKNLDERAAPTGHRDFDSQGPMFDQRTNRLSPAGVQATAALRQRRMRPDSLESLLYSDRDGRSSGISGKHDMGGPRPFSPLSTTPPDWWDVEGGLPPGVPPGSVRVNGGINPNVWAYITPDGRFITGSRPRESMLGGMAGPVSTTQPVNERSQLSSPYAMPRRLSDLT